MRERVALALVRHNRREADERSPCQENGADDDREDHRMIFRKRKQPDTESPTAPTRQTEPDSTCLSCGVGIVGPDLTPRTWADGTRRFEVRDMWAMCSTCEALSAKHGKDHRGAMVEMLGRVLGEDLDTSDHAAREAATGLPLAKYHDG